MLFNLFPYPDSVLLEPAVSRRSRLLVDLVEREKEFLLTAELPGLDKKDVKISFENGVLTISGERKETKEKKHETYYCRERYEGKFERAFNLPDNVAIEKVDAKMKDGVSDCLFQRNRNPFPRRLRSS